MFNSFDPEVLFQEVPDEISLAFTITGCKVACAGCHSQETWDCTNGKVLTDRAFFNYIHQYRGFITCVLFFGGEWNARELINKLSLARKMDLKTCLYTGLPKISNDIQRHLSFLKTGKWDASLGGLNSPTTNQRLINVKTGELLNYKFRENACATT